MSGSGASRLVVAAIDCGTNSTRLLVTDGQEAIAREMRITRLGRNTSTSGRLALDAIERTVAVLTEYRRMMDDLGVTRVRATATSAARDAANAEEFFDAAEAVLGMRPELISGDEEAALSFRGATAELDPADGPFLVVDIGGGSTEFAFGGAQLEGALSCDLGCVRLTEAWLHHDPPRPEELSQALSIVELHCDDVDRLVPGAAGAATLVGLAGTVATAAAVEQGLHVYDRDRLHHFTLTKAAAEDVFRTLATERHDERIENPGMEPDRADVIVAGMCILVGVMRHFGFASCLTSEADILDGLAAGLLEAG